MIQEGAPRERERERERESEREGWLRRLVVGDPPLLFAYLYLRMYLLYFILLFIIYLRMT